MLKSILIRLAGGLISSPLVLAAPLFLAAVLFLVAAPASAAERATTEMLIELQHLASGAQRTKRECTCRYKGMDLPLGTTICMGKGSNARQATCTMALNNTSWAVTRHGCEIADRDTAPTLRHLTLTSQAAIRAPAMPY